MLSTLSRFGGTACIARGLARALFVLSNAASLNAKSGKPAYDDVPSKPPRSSNEAYIHSVLCASQVSQLLPIYWNLNNSFRISHTRCSVTESRQAGWGSILAERKLRDAHVLFCRPQCRGSRSANPVLVTFGAFILPPRLPRAKMASSRRSCHFSQKHGSSHITNQR